MTFSTDLCCPLVQSPHYARACAAMGIAVMPMVWRREGHVYMHWQVQRRDLPVLGTVELVSRGPVVQADSDLQAWPMWCQRHQRRPMLFNAPTMAIDRLQATGFWPVITPASLAMLRLGPASAMRDSLRQKWRNRLNRALDTPLRVLRRPLPPDHWVLKAEAEQARKRGYRGLPPALSLAYAQTNPGQAWVFEARIGSNPVAALVVLQHGAMATWQIGVTLEDGRRTNAMNLLLWQAMTHLYEHGHTCLDLGIINTDDSAGLARFKLGTGAQVERLGGTWLFHPALAPVARRLPARMAA